MRPIPGRHLGVCQNRIPREDIRFTVGGRTYTLKQMEDVVDNRWELRQIATVTCLKPGGLLVTQNGLPFLQAGELKQSIGYFRELFADAFAYLAKPLEDQIARTFRYD